MKKYEQIILKTINKLSKTSPSDFVDVYTSFQNERVYFYINSLGYGNLL